jgi:hypothetical protein
MKTGSRSPKAARAAESSALNGQSYNGQSLNGHNNGSDEIPPPNGKGRCDPPSSLLPCAPDNQAQARSSRNGNGSQPKQSVRGFCAVHSSISPKTVRELMRRGLLHLNDEHWRFGDSSNRGVTRSLDDLGFKHSHTRGATWHGLIGLSDLVENDRREAWLVIEGSKDALAAAEIAQRLGVLHEVGILAALSSGYRPIPAELEKLRGRRVRVIGDNDAAGRNTMLLVSNKLTDTGIDHAIWNWDGDRSKDLYDWLSGFDVATARNGGGEGASVVEGVKSGVNGKFLPPSLSPPQSSSLHVFKSRNRTPRAKR